MAVIVLDFDATCVKHDYPNGPDNLPIPHAVPVIKELVDNGHKIVLFTMRCDVAVAKGIFKSGLADAVAWFKAHDIPLYGIQTNPTQSQWTLSPKAYGDLIIDDTALGCPTMKMDGVDYEVVDWIKVRELLVEKGYLAEKK